MSALCAATRNRQEARGRRRAPIDGREGGVGPVRPVRLVRLVLLWFVLSLGTAFASPIVHPQASELVCSSTGVGKMILLTDEGGREVGASHLDCPLCLPSAALPPTQPVAMPAVPLPAHAVPPVASQRIVARLALQPPARGPPAA